MSGASLPFGATLPGSPAGAGEGLRPFDPLGKPALRRAWRARYGGVLSNRSFYGERVLDWVGDGLPQTRPGSRFNDESPTSDQCGYRLAANVEGMTRVA